MNRKPTTSERGYGTAHQKKRVEWAPKVAAGMVRCARCQAPIAPELCPCPKCRKPTRKGGKAGRGFCGWDLGHLDGTGKRIYTGPEHACCNRGTAAHRKRPVGSPGRVSRKW